ncbi:MAG TPA: protein kinase [Kofleriaceae bacterium]|nr:protein kinase [Kofleriaceae bacterium]
MGTCVARLMVAVNLVGQHVGNYVVLKQLGAGGMGTVYLAEHPVLKRKVAIKVLHDEHTLDADLVARFFQEARAAAAIGEQHIIEVIDAGELHVGERKVCYLMMELLDGKSLGKRIEQGPIPPDETAHIVHQVCMALAASHEKGIIHRDLKPENIYLCPRMNDPEFVKVLDFGIAKLTGIAKGSGRATRIGTVLGTPAYMSPEQCVGIADVDPRADIYALGILMYEMLTGHLPFDGDVGELIEAHLRRAPIPPSVRNPALSPAWDAIVLHCLEKARDDRFRTMDEVDAAISDPAAHLLAYQLQVATRASVASGPHRTAVLPPELRPDHVAAVRAASEVATSAGAGGAAAVTAVPTPVPASVVPLIPLMPTISAPPTERMSPPTPLPGPAPMGTPAPFMAPTPYETPVPAEVAKPRARLLLWIGTGVAVAAAGTVFVAGLLMRGPGETAKDASRRAVPTEVATTSGSATMIPPASVVPPPKVIAPPAGSAAPVAGSAAPSTGSAAPAAGSAQAGSAQPAVDINAPIRVTITTEPEGAKVTLKRGTKTWTGTSPHVLELTAGAKPEPVTITVVAPGYRAVTQKVTPRKDAEILIVLTRIPVEPRKPRHTTSGDDLIRP